MFRQLAVCKPEIGALCDWTYFSPFGSIQRGNGTYTEQDSFRGFCDSGGVFVGDPSRLYWRPTTITPGPKPTPTLAQSNLEGDPWEDLPPGAPVTKRYVQARVLQPGTANADLCHEDAKAFNINLDKEFPGRTTRPAETATISGAEFAKLWDSEQTPGYYVVGPPPTPKPPSPPKAEIWLISEGDYKDYEIVAAFTTRELAEAALPLFDEGYSKIETVPLNPVSEPIPEGMKPFRGYRYKNKGKWTQVFVMPTSVINYFTEGNDEREYYLLAADEAQALQLAARYFAELDFNAKEAEGS